MDTWYRKPKAGAGGLKSAGAPVVRLNLVGNSDPTQRRTNVKSGAWSGKGTAQGKSRSLPCYTAVPLDVRVSPKCVPRAGETRSKPESQSDAPPSAQR